MAIIAFIKIIASISSILIKIIAVPFIGLKKCLSGFIKLIKKFFVFFYLVFTKLTKKVHKPKKKAITNKKKVSRWMPKKNDTFGIRTVKRVYWITRTLVTKVYWALHSVFRRIYWRTRGIIQRIYWRLYTLCQRVYWGIRGILQKLYWKEYVESRRLYGFLCRNDYLDLFFVFFRSKFSSDCIKLEYKKIYGVREYVSENSINCNYKVIEPGKKRIVCKPLYFECSKQEIEEYTSPDIYLAEIEAVQLVGASSVVIAQDKFLNDTVFYDKEKRFDIRFSSVKKVIKGIAVIEQSNIEEHYKEGINLVGAASFNYYHLIIEILSRLTFVDYFEEYRDLPIFVDAVVTHIPQFLEALRYINKFNHPVIVINSGQKCVVDRLILPSSNVWMPINLYRRDLIKSSDFLISETVLFNIRSAVGLKEDIAPWKKIFISRKNTKALRLKNEEEVRSIFEANGFEIVYTEDMTFIEQVDCFRQAKFVVATSGAALTNIVFCQEGTKIGCIIPQEHRFYMYSTIAYLLHCEPVFLDAEIIERTPYAAADTFILDPLYVKRYIKEVVSQ